MTDRLNPQAEQMADESMMRTLAAQAEALWPQELPLLDRYRLPGDALILDAGCGSGEISRRLLARYPGARLLGIDVLEGSLALARQRAAALGERARFENRSVFSTGLDGGAFDLVVCRHVLQAIPHPERALAELVRVTRPGGWLHLLVEDYGMVHFPRRRRDPDEFWSRVRPRFEAALGTDMRIGRHAPPLLVRLGLTDIRVDYLPLDTLRVPRPVFSAIWAAWRDGYVEVLARHTGMPEPEVRDHFDDMIATLEDPASYALWMVPVASARRPA